MSKEKVKITGRIDSSCNMGYIYLKDINVGESVKQRTVEIDEIHLVLDFDENDKLIGIEVFSPKKCLHPDILDQLEETGISEREFL